MSQAPAPQTQIAPSRRRFDAETREDVVAEICMRLARGEPLVHICRDAHMPSVMTVWTWSVPGSELALAIQRAREVGYDAIAARMRNTARGLGPEHGGDSTGDVQRDKLIVETDLKLLAKWDPKRYGDAQQLRLADADGGKLDTAPLVAQLLDAVRQGRTPPEGEEG